MVFRHKQTVHSHPARGIAAGPVTAGVLQGKSPMFDIWGKGSRRPNPTFVAQFRIPSISIRWHVPATRGTQLFQQVVEYIFLVRLFLLQISDQRDPIKIRLTHNSQAFSPIKTSNHFVWRHTSLPHVIGQGHVQPNRPGCRGGGGQATSCLVLVLGFKHFIMILIF